MKNDIKSKNQIILYPKEKKTIEESPYSLKLLVIEDNPGDIRLIQKMLNKTSSVLFDVKYATRLKDGLKLLEIEKFDLILLDLNLPDSRGLDTLTTMLSQEPDTPVVILTALYDEAFGIKLVQNGAQDYIIKGKVDSNLLLRSIRYAIERQSVNEELKKSESRLFNIINKNVDGIVVVDPDGIVRFVNPAIESIFGLKSEKLLGELFGFPVVAEKTTELNIIHKSGKTVYVEMRVVVTDWEGQIAYIASLRDITKRKQAEEKINQQNIFLNTIIESIHNPFYVIDVNDYKIKMANSAAKSGNLIENPTCYAITHKRNKPCDETEYVCPLRELKKNKKPVVVEHIHCDKDGNYRDVEVHGYPIFDSEGNVSQMIEYTLDITERKNLQEQLRHSQKMEAIGQLAGGIAHKFNNLLMALSGYSELLLNHLNEDDPLYENAGKIKEVTYRAASLTRELLTFSRKQNLSLEILDLNKLVIETGKILKPFIGADIEIVTLLEPELGQVKADSDQIEQIIMNLAVNARDAMPKGGILTIQTQNMTIDEKYCRAFPESKPGRFVCLVIKDTGVGMDREIIKHIFEPFFSTKARGKGTGLGLSTVYGIIKQHAGWITVKSKPGKGSTFSIFLPSVEKTSSL